MIKIFHLNMLNTEERDRLNDPDSGGWDSEPRFTRYADITGFGSPSQILVAMANDEYSLVATVESDDLERAFYLTNHIESDWMENSDVKPEPGFNHRSSSVGDIFVLNGKPSIVSRFGFQELDSTEDLS